MTTERKRRKPGPIFSHEQREKAIRLAVRGLIEGVSSLAIQKKIAEEMEKELGRPLNLSKRMLDLVITHARKRIRSEFNQDLSAHAEDQVALLREIQRRMLAHKGSSAQAYHVIVHASRQLSRLLGLDSPLEMRHIVEEGDRLKGALLEAVKESTDDPALLSRIAAALAKQERHDRPPLPDTPEPPLQEDLEDFEDFEDFEDSGE